MERTCIAIDLKSFYASVECAQRSLDALSTHLIVADSSRTEKTICLAVSPSLKAYGISGRARLFEVVERVREVNRERLLAVPPGPDGVRRFRGVSFDAWELAEDPSLELGYIVAPPRMKLYEQISTRIFSIYMKYISEEDIHVYSVDECFMEATGYLKTYGMTGRELAMTMIRDVLYATGITATAGIGSNLYLAKIAMDIVAKHVPADRDGVRIAELDERSYREQLWCHRPLTDFWRVGRGIARRLAALGCHTMGDVARMSLQNEDALYGALGIGAELLIDHAWGWEPTEIAEIRSYRPESESLSSGQVLSEPYRKEQGRLIIREMTELLALDLVRKGLVTRKLELTVCYDRESLLMDGNVCRVALTGKQYAGKVSADPYGRPVPKHTHGTENLDRWSSASGRLAEGISRLYDRIVSPDLLIRRVYVVAAGLVREKEIPAEQPEQLDLFTDYEDLARRNAAEAAADARDRRLQEAALQIQERFGKNAVLRGMNLTQEGTTVERNGQVGGHRAE